MKAYIKANNEPIQFLNKCLVKRDDKGLLRCPIDCRHTAVVVYTIGQFACEKYN